MCPLKCPGCERTKFKNQFPSKWANKNLNLEHLKSFLDIDLSGKIIKLCGNKGDPIYYNRLLELIEYFKNQGSSIIINTNGSYQSSDWWNQLGGLLEKTDNVIFAIDGLPSNFKKYRINADWDSIRLGINVLTKYSVHTVWKFIPFSFNETNVEEANILADKLGMNEFYVGLSDRWDEELEWLKPSDNFLGWRHESIVEWRKDNSTGNIDPRCKTSNEYHYISSDGFYVPCCFFADYRFYYKSEFYKNRDLYDISKTSITKILQSDHCSKFYSSIEEMRNPCCTFSCPKL